MEDKEPITRCALLGMYLYSGFHFPDMGEQILDGHFLAFEVNLELKYDFITSLN